MLIKVFKTSFLLQYILLLILGGLLWWVSFFYPGTIDLQINPYLTPGYALLDNFIAVNMLTGTISAFSLIMIGAFFLNFILAKFALIPKNTLIPGLVYIVFMSHSTSLLYFHPVVIPAFLMIVVLYFLFQVYTATEAYAQIFNSGFIIAIASFFYFPSFYLILVVWISFIVFRLYYWREWLIVFFGFLTPFLFLWTYFFWIDELHLVFGSYAEYFSGLKPFDFDLQFSILNYIVSAILIIFVLWSVFLVAGDLNEKTISVRKGYWLLFWFFIIATLTNIIACNFFRVHQVLLFIPSTAFIAYSFLRSHKTLWMDLFFSLLVILILIKNFIIVFE
ncbi:MAG: hypothetical protein R2764_16540 [Bacteroidales bacterium]